MCLNLLLYFFAQKSSQHHFYICVISGYAQYSLFICAIYYYCFFILFLCVCVNAHLSCLCYLYDVLRCSETIRNVSWTFSSFLVQQGRSFGVSHSWRVIWETPWISVPSISARGRCLWANWIRTGSGYATITVRARWTCVTFKSVFVWFLCRDVFVWIWMFYNWCLFSVQGKPDLNTSLPVRQTASIFKQPVTKVTNHPSNKVKTDPQKAVDQPRQVTSQLAWFRVNDV